MIDLHTHTTASDGTLSPRQLVQAAAAVGLSAIAVTDHDTTAGLEEALDEAGPSGVRVVPGVEISIEFRGPRVGGRPGWLHLLAYFLPAGGLLAGKLERLQRWRRERNGLMVEKLRRLGMDITLEQVAALSGGGQVGRPHFARALLEAGYVDNLQQAFDRYLKKGAAAYVDKQRLTIDQALQLVRGDGAVAVLAHPFSLGLGDEELSERLARWRWLGLAGMEVEYPEHDSDLRRRLHRLAAHHQLVATGGSDFHGTNKDGIELGRGHDGNISVPDEVLAELERRR